MYTNSSSANRQADLDLDIDDYDYVYVACNLNALWRSMQLKTTSRDLKVALQLEFLPIDSEPNGTPLSSITAAKQAEEIKKRFIRVPEHVGLKGELFVDCEETSKSSLAMGCTWPLLLPPHIFSAQLWIAHTSFFRDMNAFVLSNWLQTMATTLCVSIQPIIIKADGKVIAQKVVDSTDVVEVEGLRSTLCHQRDTMRSAAEAAKRDLEVARREAEALVMGARATADAAKDEAEARCKELEVARQEGEALRRDADAFRAKQAEWRGELYRLRADLAREREAARAALEAGAAAEALRAELQAARDDAEAARGQLEEGRGQLEAARAAAEVAEREAQAAAEEARAARQEVAFLQGQIAIASLEHQLEIQGRARDASAPALGRQDSDRSRDSGSVQALEAALQEARAEADRLRSASLDAIEGRLGGMGTAELEALQTRLAEATVAVAAARVRAALHEAVLRDRDRDRESVATCVVCFERVVGVTLAPCGHTRLCSFCAASVAECPDCRAPIEGRASGRPRTAAAHLLVQRLPRVSRREVELRARTYAEAAPLGALGALERAKVESEEMDEPRGVEPLLAALAAGPSAPALREWGPLARRPGPIPRDRPGPRQVPKATGGWLVLEHDVSWEDLALLGACPALELFGPIRLYSLLLTPELLASLTAALRRSRRLGRLELSILADDSRGCLPVAAAALAAAAAPLRRLEITLGCDGRSVVDSAESDAGVGVLRLAALAPFADCRIQELVVALRGGRPGVQANVRALLAGVLPTARVISKRRF
eukprot:tig00000981_g5880.t1